MEGRTLWVDLLRRACAFLSLSCGSMTRGDLPHFSSSAAATAAIAPDDNLAIFRRALSRRFPTDRPQPHSTTLVEITSKRAWLDRGLKMSKDDTRPTMLQLWLSATLFPFSSVRRRTLEDGPSDKGMKEKHGKWECENITCHNRVCPREPPNSSARTAR